MSNEFDYIPIPEGEKSPENVIRVITLLVAGAVALLCVLPLCAFFALSIL